MLPCLAAYTVDKPDDVLQYIRKHPNSAVVLSTVALRIKRIWNAPYLRPSLFLEQNRDNGSIALIIQFTGTDQPVLDAHHLFQLRQERAREELEPTRIDSIIVQILYSRPSLA